MAVLVNLKIDLGLIVVIRVGIDGAECLFGFYLVALFDLELAEVGIDGSVVTMLYDNGIGVTQYHTAGHLALIDCPCRAAGGGLQVDTLVINRHVLIDGVLVHAEGTADETFLHGPGQAAFVLLETTRQ